MERFEYTKLNNPDNYYFNPVKEDGVTKIKFAPDKSALIGFYTATALNKVLSMFRYEYLPRTVPKRDLEMIVQLNGKGIFSDVRGHLVILSGDYAPPMNINNREMCFLVNRPNSRILPEDVNKYSEPLNKQYIIDEDCVLIRNDSLECGTKFIIDKYATEMTQADISKVLALINLRAIYSIITSTDTEKASAEVFLGQIAEGRQGVMMGEDLASEIKTQPYATSINGYLTQIIETEQYIKGNFYQDIGLQSTFNMKRERLSEAESGVDTDCLRPFIDNMLEERKLAIEKVNEKYGTNIEVEFNSSWSKYNNTDIIVPISNDSGVEDAETTDEGNAEFNEEGSEQVEGEGTPETEVTEEVVKDESEPEQLVETITEELAEKVLEKLVEAVTETKDEESEEDNEDKRDNAEPTD